MNIAPPKDLADREPLIFWTRNADFWYRSHDIGQSPVFFGKTMSGRWDAPGGQYGALYLATDKYGAFMESIGRFALRSRFVGEARLRSKGLSELRFKRRLKLIDLASSSGLTRIGAEASLSSGSGYKNSQRWSKALREHPIGADGIYYAVRHDPARTAVMLFDHCEPEIEVVGLCTPWAIDAMLGEILDHYRFGTDL